MRVLLDTSAYSAMHRGHREVEDRIRRAEELLMSPIVVGELLHGFRHGSRFAHNAKLLQAFLDHPHVRTLSLTIETADRFGLIAAARRRKGQPIPTHDIWIAGHALETGAILLSFDSHFEAIEGLAVSVFKNAA